MITMEMYKLMAKRQFGSSVTPQGSARLSRTQIATIHAMLEAGHGLTEVAKQVGCTVASVQYRQKKMRAVAR